MSTMPWRASTSRILTSRSTGVPASTGPRHGCGCRGTPQEERVNRPNRQIHVSRVRDWISAAARSGRPYTLSGRVKSGSSGLGGIRIGLVLPWRVACSDGVGRQGGAEPQGVRGLAPQQPGRLVQGGLSRIRLRPGEVAGGGHTAASGQSTRASRTISAKMSPGLIRPPPSCSTMTTASALSPMATRSSGPLYRYPLQSGLSATLCKSPNAPGGAARRASTIFRRARSRSLQTPTAPNSGGSPRASTMVQENRPSSDEEGAVTGTGATGRGGECSSSRDDIRNLSHAPSPVTRADGHPP